MNVIAYKEKYKDLVLQMKNIILEDIEDAPLGILQQEINDTKEYQKKQINYIVIRYKELSKNSLEDSIQAPNENSYEKPELYKTKITTVLLLGNSKE